MTEQFLDKPTDKYHQTKYDDVSKRTKDNERDFLPCLEQCILVVQVGSVWEKLEPKRRKSKMESNQLLYLFLSLLSLKVTLLLSTCLNDLDNVTLHFLFSLHIH